MADLVFWKSLFGGNLSVLKLSTGQRNQATESDTNRIPGLRDERRFLLTTQIGEMWVHLMVPIEIKTTFCRVIRGGETENNVIDLSEMGELSHFGRLPIVEIGESALTLTKGFTDSGRNFEVGTLLS